MKGSIGKSIVGAALAILLGWIVPLPLIADDAPATRPDPIQLSILQPDGKPAANAKVIVTDLFSMVTITFDQAITIAPFLSLEAPFECTSASDGTVSIPPQADWYGVAVFHATGYAEVYPNGRDKTQGIQLQPYARLQGRLMAGDKPGAGQEVCLVPGNWTRPNLGLVHQVEAVCDADGNFVIPRVPPREYTIVRILSRAEEPSWTGRNGKPVDFIPGQTLDVQLGGTGRPVVVKAILPEELSQRKDLKWDKFTATAEKPNVGWQSYDAQLLPDGTFKFEDVDPGQYKLELAINNPNMRLEGSTNLGPLAKESTEFTVPPIPDGRTDEPLYIGSVKLQMINYVIVGSPAPDFCAKTLDGKDIKLSDFHGKYVLLDFWATWCEPCVEETPDLKDVFDTFGNDNRFAMISVNLDDKQSDAKDYVKENAMTWPQIPELENNDQPIVRQFGVDSIPSIWLIGPDGKVLAKNLRGDKIKSTIAKALNE